MDAEVPGRVPLEPPSVPDAAAERDVFHPTRRSVAAWVIYDLANTTFMFGIGSRYFGLWVIEESGGADWQLGLATATAIVAVVLLGPWLGARSDHAGRRRTFLVRTTLITVAATALLATGSLEQSLVLYAVGSVGFHLSLIVYDAMLPDVSTPTTRGRISGLGVACGYLGSLLALGIGAYLLPRAGYLAVFRGLALAFLVLALPAFLWVRERPRKRTPGRPPGLLASPATALGAWHDAARQPGLVRFLIGRFLYTDATNTVFLFVAVFAKLEIGFTDAQTDVVLAEGACAALVGAFVAGRVVDALGPRRVLNAGLYALMLGVAAAAAAALTGVQGIGWLVGLALGLGVGASSASDRVYMLRLTPPEQLGKYFGLYATVGRFATMAGPLAWAFVADALGWGRVAALCGLGLFLVAARFVLQGVSDDVRQTESAR